MVCDVVNLLVEFHVDITLVSGSLPLEAANALFDLFLYVSKLVYGFVFGRLDLSVYFIMKALIFNGHFVLNLSDLDLDDLISFFDLEICDLANQWFNFISNLFDEFSTLNWVEFSWSLGTHHHLHLRSHHRIDLLLAHVLIGGTTLRASRWDRCSSHQRTHGLTVRHHEALFTIWCGDNIACFGAWWSFHHEGLAA